MMGLRDGGLCLDGGRFHHSVHVDTTSDFQERILNAFRSLRGVGSALPVFPGGRFGFCVEFALFPKKNHPTTCVP